MRARVMLCTLATAACIGGGVAVFAVPAAYAATTHATAASQTPPPPVTNGNGLPPVCGPKYDGVIWTLPGGTKLVCTYYQGAWQWIPVVQGCGTGAVTAVYAREASPDC
jgi:hypothetical protein